LSKPPSPMPTASPLELLRRLAFVALALMPLRMNESKNDKIGTRQIDLTRKLHSADLLSAEGRQKIDSHPQR